VVQVWRALAEIGRDASAGSEAIKMQCLASKPRSAWVVEADWDIPRLQTKIRVEGKENAS
jgi:hypothetical protein